MLISFRPCTPKDHPALLRLVMAYYRFDKIPFRRQSMSQGLATLLRSPSHGHAWLLEKHDKAVGYAILIYSFDLEYGGVEGLLTDLYVSKPYRKQGIGSLALYEVEDYCRERGIRVVEVQVQSRNRAAEVFYRKAGFRNLARKLLILEVRPEQAIQARRAAARASANKRR